MQDNSATVSPGCRVPAARPSHPRGPCAPSPAVRGAAIRRRVVGPSRPASWAREAGLRLTYAHTSCTHNDSHPLHPLPRPCQPPYTIWSSRVPRCSMQQEYLSTCPWSEPGHGRPTCTSQAAFLRSCRPPRGHHTCSSDGGRPRGTALCAPSLVSPLPAERSRQTHTRHRRQATARGPVPRATS